MNRVFVYGTLKKGEPNHHWFSKDGTANFVCEAETVNKFPLVIATKYNIPFLLYSPGNGHNVKGELYEVCDKAFANLDTLEDHPNFYVREKEPVKCLTDKNEEVHTWIYFLKDFKSNLLETDMLTSYSSNGSHGKKYAERYQRLENYDYKREVLDR